MEKCDMGVGCAETGVCYAEAQGQPEMCPIRPTTPEITRLQLQVIDETADDLFLSPCTRSALIVGGFYTRRADPEVPGVWLCELTEQGKAVLKPGKLNPDGSVPDWVPLGDMI